MLQLVFSTLGIFACLLPWFHLPMKRVLWGIDLGGLVNGLLFGLVILIVLMSKIYCEFSGIQNVIIFVLGCFNLLLGIWKYSDILFQIKSILSDPFKNGFIYFPGLGIFLLLITSAAIAITSIIDEILSIYKSKSRN